MRALAAGIMALVWAQAAGGRTPQAEPAAAAPAAAQSPPVIANPEWERTPLGDELAELYPDRARDEDVNGRVRMRCEVGADARVSNCVILEEIPAGYGFGRASLSAARYFKMRPKTVNAAPVAGGVVFIPISWVVLVRDVVVETPGLDVRPLMLTAATARYPESALDTGAEGDVWVRGTVRPDGSVADVSVKARSASPELDQAAVEAFRRWTFAPAEDAALRPVESVVAAKFAFHWEESLDIWRMKCRHLTIALDRFSRIHPGVPVIQAPINARTYEVLARDGGPRAVERLPDAITRAAATCRDRPDALYLDVVRNGL
jgi:TonB family protein